MRALLIALLCAGCATQAPEPLPASPAPQYYRKQQVRKPLAPVRVLKRVVPSDITRIQSELERLDESIQILQGTVNSPPRLQ